MRVFYVQSKEVQFVPGPNSKKRRFGAAEVLKGTGLICSAKTWDEVQALEQDFFEALSSGIRQFSGCFDTALITLNDKELKSRE